MAYVFVKSYRVFSTTPPDEIKMSRGNGWFFPTQSYTDFVQDRMDDVPFKGSVVDWNKAHSSAASPEEIEKRLNVLWHAYAGEAKTLSSTDKIEFWKTRPIFHFSRGTVTYYLIKFPANSKTPAPFFVGLQSQVTEFELEFYSNIEEISGTYRFLRK